MSINTIPLYLTAWQTVLVHHFLFLFYPALYFRVKRNWRTPFQILLLTQLLFVLFPCGLDCVLPNFARQYKTIYSSVCYFTILCNSFFPCWLKQTITNKKKPNTFYSTCSEGWMRKNKLSLNPSKIACGCLRLLVQVLPSLTLNAW